MFASYASCLTNAAFIFKDKRLLTTGILIIATLALLIVGVTVWAFPLLYRLWSSGNQQQQEEEQMQHPTHADGRQRRRGGLRRVPQG